VELVNGHLKPCGEAGEFGTEQVIKISVHLVLFWWWGGGGFKNTNNVMCK
jgi:hypothetical protein